MDPLVTTTRLTLREWSDDDAPAALAIYGATQVARWLTPAVEQIPDLEAMRSALQTWQQQQPGLTHRRAAGRSIATPTRRSSAASASGSSPRTPRTSS